MYFYTNGETKSEKKLREQYNDQIEKNVKGIFERYKSSWLELSIKADAGVPHLGELWKKTYLPCSAVLLLALVPASCAGGGGIFLPILISFLAGAVLAVGVSFILMLIHPWLKRKTKNKLSELERQRDLEVEQRKEKLKSDFNEALRQHRKKIDEIEQYYLDSEHYEPIVDWAIKIWSEWINNCPHASFEEYITVTGELVVNTGVITLSKLDRNSKKEGSKSFYFQTNNYKDLPDEDSCIGFAQALALRIEEAILKTFPYDTMDMIHDPDNRATMWAEADDNEITIHYKVINGSYIPPIDTRPNV